MQISIPSAGETTSIGIPAVTISATTTSDRPLTQDDMDTISQLRDHTALLIATRASHASRYLLDADVVTAGRDSKNDILLDDNTVSRDHTLFKRIDGLYYVQDAGSLNGTYVNKERIDGVVPLRNGDEIIIGRFRFVFFTNSALA